MKLPVKTVELIEDLPFYAIDNWYIMLACTGQKSGSWVTIASGIWREGDAVKRVDPAQIASIEETFDTLKLFYRKRIRTTSAGLWQPSKGELKRIRMNEMYDYFVATTEGGAIELYNAVESGDHKRIGHALDLPQTAVEAFDITRGPEVTVKELVDRGDLPDDAKNIVQFILSRDHYKEEFDRVQAWAKTLRENSSILDILIRR